MDIKEFEARIDTVYSICCDAIMFRKNFHNILLDENKTKVVFPNIRTTNPKITFSIDNLGEIHAKTKNEILNETNYDLYQAWMINFGIIGMTSVLEYFLKTIAEKISGKQCKGSRIFAQFENLTNIDLTEFENFGKIVEYYQVRHISMHNYSKMDEKFLDKTKLQYKSDTPYKYSPVHLKHYKCLLILFAEFILEESKI